MAISLVTACIVPRGLGPKAYGDFQFLSSFFSRVVGFLDTGTSIAFYTKLSQRQSDFGLVAFYFFFMSACSMLLLFFVGGAHLVDISNILWPEQTTLYVFLGAIWGVLNWWLQVLNKVTDAYGVTVSAEKAKIIQRVVGLGVICALFFAGQLGLISYFCWHYFLMLFLACCFVYTLERAGNTFMQSWKLTASQFKGYVKEFYNYSHPLFVYALIGLFVGIMERWMLQYFGGSLQQGYFGLSSRIGSICFLFTSAMSPLIMREFAIAFDRQDVSEMRRLFRRYIPFLYAVAAYFACFIAVQAKTVTYIIGGDKFQLAMTPVMIMAFYPIHQTYGQLSGSVFYATGQTKLYRNIGTVFMLVSLPVAYFFIAPPDKFGLGAGATGLALEMVVLQFVAVNVQLFYNSRFLKLKFHRYVGHQIFVVLWFFLCALAASLCRSLFEDGLRDVLSFLVDGIIYTFLVIVSTLAQPKLFGLYRKDIVFAYKAAMPWLTARKK